MKVEPKDLDRQGLHALMGEIIVPRPIAFVSTLGGDGIYNAAPFATFARICLVPLLVCFSISRSEGQKKDTLKNIESSKDFVINVVDEALAEPMNQTSARYPSHVDEIREAGLTAIGSDRVRSPRIAEAPVSLECQLVQILEFGEGNNISSVIIGEVLLIHVKDELMVEGHVEASRLKAVGRMGEGLYCRARDVFEMKPPRLQPG